MSILSLFPWGIPALTDQDIPGILWLSSQWRPLLFKRGPGSCLCVFRFAWVILVVSRWSAGARGDVPWAAPLCTSLACFSILKSQESPWKMLQEGCLILASLWCIPLVGWKQGTLQTNSFTNSSCLLFFSVTQHEFYWAASLKEQYDDWRTTYLLSQWTYLISVRYMCSYCQEFFFLA